MQRNVLLPALLLLIVWLGLTGCNIVGGVTGLVSPPPLIKAKHALADKPTLVVLDDRRGLVNNPLTLNRISTAVQSALEAEEVVTTGFVGPNELAALRQELGEEYANTSLAALAIRLDARQVIHAEVDGYQMGLGGDLIRPSISLKVKVFDLDQRTRVFPAAIDPETGTATGSETYPVQSRMPARDVTGQSAARTLAARELADQAGRDIARLFFDWRMPERGEGIDR